MQSIILQIHSREVKNFYQSLRCHHIFYDRNNRNCLYVLLQFAITVAFCDETVSFCNKKPNAFCNKLLPNFCNKIAVVLYNIICHIESNMKRRVKYDAHAVGSTNAKCLFC